MSTNYYAAAKVECEGCGSLHTCTQAIHLGKSSAGWQFTFAYNGGRYYKNLEEMQQWLKHKTIWDEYGKQITTEDFWSLVDSKRDGLSHDDTSYGIIVDGIYFLDGEFS